MQFHSPPTSTHSDQPIGFKPLMSHRLGILLALFWWRCMIRSLRSLRSPGCHTNETNESVAAKSPCQCYPKNGLDPLIDPR
jgi:hypothetical protein